VSGVGRALRAEYLLPIACAAAAVCVGVSEFMTIFEFDRGTSGEPVLTKTAADRHYYSLLVLAAFALLALVVAVVAGSRPAAMAVAVAGGLSLLIFLLVDLPDLNREGPLEDRSVVFIASKAEPANGFWLEMVGTIALAFSGGALATLRPEQLRVLLPERLREPGAGHAPDEGHELGGRPDRAVPASRKGPAPAGGERVEGAPAAAAGGRSRRRERAP
jgi:hypothetical protein